LNPDNVGTEVAFEPKFCD